MASRASARRSSKRIVDARKQREFKDWPDLMSRVKGVKEKAAARLSAEGLTVNGQSFQAAPRRPAQAAGRRRKSAKVKAEIARSGLCADTQSRLRAAFCIGVQTRSSARGSRERPESMARYLHVCSPVARPHPSMTWSAP